MRTLQAMAMESVEETRGELVIEDDAMEEARRVVSRAQLYELVWAQPMLKVAASFGVSSSYLARVCSSLRVPRPPRGYWAKLAVGKASKKPPLPKARPGDESHWRRDPYWYREPDVSLPLPAEVPSEDNVESQQDRSTQTRQHPLLKDAKSLLLTGGRSRDMAYLKPNKKYLVDLIVTERILSKAIAFANRLYSACERQGYTVTLAPTGERLQRTSLDVRKVPTKHRVSENLWSPHRCTVVYVGKLAIGLTIFELAEEVEMRYVGDGKYVPVNQDIKPKRVANPLDWTTRRDVPTGRLGVQAYCPYMHAAWSLQWHEENGGDLIALIPEIVSQLREVAPSLVDQIEEGRRRAEAEYQEWEARNEAWRRKQSEREAAEALKKSRADLLKLIAEWDEARRVEAFFRDANERVHELPEPERTTILAVLERAKKLVEDANSLNGLRAWAALDTLPK